MCGLTPTLPHYPAAFDDASRGAGWTFTELIEASDSDAEVPPTPSATGRRVVLPAQATELAGRLAACGFEPVGVDLSELRQAGGGPKRGTLVGCVREPAYRRGTSGQGRPRCCLTSTAWATRAPTSATAGFRRRRPTRDRAQDYRRPRSDPPWTCDILTRGQDHVVMVDEKGYSCTYRPVGPTPPEIPTCPLVS